MKSRIPAVSRDRHANALDRVIGAAALMLNQAEQMKGLGMTGVDRQDVTANPLRIGRASRVLMGERRVEPPGDRRRWAARHATVIARSGSGAPPLSSVHRHLIAQPTDTYPPMRDNR